MDLIGRQMADAGRGAVLRDRGPSPARSIMIFSFMRKNPRRRKVVPAEDSFAPAQLRQRRERARSFFYIGRAPSKGDGQLASASFGPAALHAGRSSDRTGAGSYGRGPQMANSAGFMEWPAPPSGVVGSPEHQKEE